MNDKKKIDRHSVANVTETLTDLFTCFLIIGTPIMALGVIVLMAISVATKKYDIAHISEPYKIIRMECESHKATSSYYIVISQNTEDKMYINVNKDEYYSFIVGDEIQIDHVTGKSWLHMADSDIYRLCNCESKE